jgi:hypothetical protein
MRDEYYKYKNELTKLSESSKWLPADKLKHLAHFTELVAILRLSTSILPGGRGKFLQSPASIVNQVLSDASLHHAASDAAIAGYCSSRGVTAGFESK